MAPGSLSDLRWPDFSDYRTRVQEFYEPIGYSLAWFRDGMMTDQARAVIETLKEGANKGLNAEDYDGSRWADRLARLHHSGNPLSNVNLARLDLALTVSVMRYISDVHLGRVNPGLFHASFDLENEKDNLPGFIRRRLIDATDVKAVLDGIEPPYKGYWRTEEALQRYIIMAREDNGGLLPVPEKAVEPGGSYTAIAQLAGALRRLRATGYGTSLRMR